MFESQRRKFRHMKSSGQAARMVRIIVGGTVMFGLVAMGAARHHKLSDEPKDNMLPTNHTIIEPVSVTPISSVFVSTEPDELSTHKENPDLHNALTEPEITSEHTVEEPEKKPESLKTKSPIYDVNVILSWLKNTDLDLWANIPEAPLLDSTWKTRNANKTKRLEFENGYAMAFNKTFANNRRRGERIIIKGDISPDTVIIVRRDDDQTMPTPFRIRFTINGKQFVREGVLSGHQDLRYTLKDFFLSMS